MLVTNPNTAELKSVRFTCDFRQFRTGDTREMDSAEADLLILRGFAEEAPGEDDEDGKKEDGGKPVKTARRGLFGKADADKDASK